MEDKKGSFDTVESEILIYQTDDKNKKIDQELPIWISEALKELEHQPAETSNKK